MFNRTNKKKERSHDMEDCLQFGPILLLNKNLMDHSLKTVKLPNPKNNTLATYFCCEDMNQIFEIFKVDENFRSWLIDDLLLKDSSIHILTQVNPVYFLLPALLKNKHRFVDLKHLLHEKLDVGYDDDVEETMYSDLSSILNISYFQSLEHITSCEIVSETIFYKFEPVKALDWLKAKVKILSEDLQVTTPSILPGFESQPNNHKKSAEKGIKAAWELVSEYLPKPLSDQLAQSFDINVEDEKNQRENPEEPSKKKFKLEGPLEDYSLNFNPVCDKPKKLTASQKSLEKVDKTGIKSITSFFTKPIKKKS